MSQITILLTHSGASAPPVHAFDNIDILRKIAPKSRILFLAEEKHAQLFEKYLSSCEVDLAIFEFIPIETITISPRTREFLLRTKLNRDFRSGFWLHASYRFFLIADYLIQTDLENVLHLENDVTLYFDPTSKIDAFHKFASFAVPLDRVRAIPGSVWFRNAGVAVKLAEFIQQHSFPDDMAALGHFCLVNQEIAKPLPTIPNSYAQKFALDTKRFSEGFELFGGVFDAAAIGQYLGGVHRLNIIENSVFFINESSDLNLDHFEFSWHFEGGHRIPAISALNQLTTILSIHVHSKELKGISPFNCAAPNSLDDYLTGERIQEVADITIGSSAITHFHGRGNIKTKALIELPENPRELLTEAGQENIAHIMRSKVIFVYTHLIPYFRHFIMPWLQREFVLITHNSDDAITFQDLGLLNNPLLVAWYAQNIEVHHTKLRPLPIGMANRQWGAQNLEWIQNASYQIKKTDLVYLNFNPNTHPARREAFEKCRTLNGVTIESELPFHSYLQSLAKHKFTICPRGNGLDTHRFWEAQYLHTIPIILRRDWNPAYSNLPVLILDNWEDLESVDLNKIYILMTTAFYDYSNLSLHAVRDAVRAELMD